MSDLAQLIDKRATRSPDLECMLCKVLILLSIAAWTKSNTADADKVQSYKLSMRLLALLASCSALLQMKSILILWQSALEEIFKGFMLTTDVELCRLPRWGLEQTFGDLAMPGKAGFGRVLIVSAVKATKELTLIRLTYDVNLGYSQRTQSQQEPRKRCSLGQRRPVR